MSIGKRLQIWRKSLGYSQSKFAKLIGIPLSTLKGYELGHRSPGSDALTSIATTGVNLNWLLSGDGQMQEDTTNEQILNSLELEVPAEFEEFFEGLFNVLLKLNEEKRASILNDMIARAQESARIDELEKALEELRQQIK